MSNGGRYLESTEDTKGFRADGDYCFLLEHDLCAKIDCYCERTEDERRPTYFIKTLGSSYDSNE